MKVAHTNVTLGVISPGVGGQFWLSCQMAGLHFFPTGADSIILVGDRSTSVSYTSFGIETSPRSKRRLKVVNVYTKGIVINSEEEANAFSREALTEGWTGGKP